MVLRVMQTVVGNISEVISICRFFNFDVYEQLVFWILVVMFWRSMMISPFLDRLQQSICRF
ncbi:hypothetical protein Hanom_Chr15g01363301 [Helianthus anomalus]